MLQKLFKNIDQLSACIKSVNEESSEFEVAVFDRIVPWAQQADKKTLNLGYKNKQLFSKYSVILA